MQRLLKDAQAITGVKYDIDNLADVYTAIGVIQEKLGIAGTTAKEAATTISGSATMMKASWQNVLTAIAGGGDMDAAIESFVYSVEKFFENIMPVIERALAGIGDFIASVTPKLVETVAKALIEAIPQLLYAVYQMIVGLAKGIIDGIKALFTDTGEKIVQDEAKAIDGATKSQKKLTQAVEDTADAQKKTLAGFDTLQTMASGANEETEQAAMNAAEGGSSGGLLDEMSGNVSNKIDAEVKKIVAVSSALLLALGMVLCFFAGPTPKSIGLIAAGAVGLAASVALNYGAIKDAIDGPIGDIVFITSTLLLALGIILCCTGAKLPLGIALIAAGAIGLVSEAVINTDAFVEIIKGPIGTIMAIGGALLIVIGIILCCTGVGIPLGLGMILMGVAMVGTYVAANWDAIYAPIKEVIDDISQWFSDLWEDIKAGWEAAVDFIDEAWSHKDLAGFELIDAYNQLVDVEEELKAARANDEIDATMRKRLEKIKEKYGDDLLALYEQLPEGATISDVVFGRVKIPGLANGAVIPPNRQFLAMLGDQKHGVNIEAPLDTIVEAFKIAQGGQNIQIEFVGSYSQLIRDLQPRIVAENNRASVFAKG